MALDAKNGNSLMLFPLFEDAVPDAEGFRGTVEAAVHMTLSGQIVTFGIRLVHAEAFYMWLELTTKSLKELTFYATAPWTNSRLTRCGSY